jgi:hypothetical protein
MTAPPTPKPSPFAGEAGQGAFAYLSPGRSLRSRPLCPAREEATSGAAP